MRVLAFDPGGTTGWVLYVDGAIRKSGQIMGAAHHSKLAEFLYTQYSETTAYGTMYIIYERFNHENNDFAKLISLEYIGVIRLFCQQKQIYEIPQNSSIKTFADAGGKIKQTGWFIPYQYKHAWDAARHLYYWLINGSHPYTEYRDELLARLKPSHRELEE